jgi:hypothetical protein
MADIIDWPDHLRPQAVDWPVPVVPQMMARSAFDGSTQAQTLGVPRWGFTAVVGPVSAELAPQWEALFARLRGMVNRVRVHDWRREAPLGPATGTPTVLAAAMGNTLQTQGWAANVPGILLPGSYFSVNNELKRLVLPASSDATGWATLTFEPPLRAAPQVGLPLVLTKPKALFVMTTPNPGVAQEGARHRGPTVAFEEVFAA